MKKVFKLLSLILASSVLVVNADTIDMHGEYFSDDTLYSSGDIYTNVMFVNDSWSGFITPVGALFYDVAPPMPTSVKIRKMAPTSEFFTYVDVSDQVFDIENNIRSKFIIPKFLGKDVLWKHSAEESSPYESETFLPRLGKVSESFDIFEPLIVKPEFEIVCNNENVNYGESTTCTLSYSFGLFDDERYTPTMLDLTIDSSEYNISNITVNEISSLSVNGNNISGNAVDSKKVNELIKGANITSDEEYLDFMSKYYTYNEECLHEISDMDPRLGGKDVIDLSDCYSAKNYKIKIATFDITPKENLSLNGMIKLSKSNIGIQDVVTNEELIKYTKAETESIVPIIGGEVKGVEEVTENPKTGIINYIYLLPLVFISAYVYHFIKKNKELFR